MKKLIFSVIGIVGLSFVMSGVVFAQGMPAPSGIEGMGGNTVNSDDHTAREEAEGKIVWEKLQAKQVSCPDLSDDDFGVLGEYFMGIMMGDSHAAMNATMIQMHGEAGEEQIHIVMGKRLSRCDASATVTGVSDGWMQMMMGGPVGITSGSNGVKWSSPFNSNLTNNPMMNFGFMPFGWFGWIFMILWWLLVIVGIIALIKWLAGQSRSGRDNEKPFDSAQGRSPLDILKERYVKGEIDKKEFEEKKKDLIG